MTSLAARAVVLTLLLAAPARAQPTNGSRADVDASIRRAAALQQAGRTAEALDVMRGAVQRSAFRDAKARYFLARVYTIRKGEHARAGRRAQARDSESMALLHLRGARDLRDAEWSPHARDRLHERARRTPLLGQYTEGGRYPHGYCGPTSLRMVLRLEGLADPGADAVALGGARPYQPGVGSWGGRLAQRARELGLKGAKFVTNGRLSDVTRSLDEGRPVLMSGAGAFSARFEDGRLRARSYGSGHYLVAVGYERGPDGKVKTLLLNDSDTGRRLRMDAAAARRFFRGDGAIWMLTYEG
ncbi:MAG: C39 family peptidase [Planctomycetes bacterium]|nr:C39 family peptidase [Planctomycetota bacterium]